MLQLTELIKTLGTQPIISDGWKPKAKVFFLGLNNNSIMRLNSILHACMVCHTYRFPTHYVTRSIKGYLDEPEVT
jgi:hypothetical protein